MEVAAKVRRGAVRNIVIDFLNISEETWNI